MVIALSSWPMHVMASQDSVVRSEDTAEVVSDRTISRPPLARLFTTAQDRFVLDQIKNMKPEDRPAEAPLNAPPAFLQQQDTPARQVLIKGIVLRENRAPVVWINEGHTIDSAEQWQDLNLKWSQRPSTELVLELFNATERAEVMPGQTWHRDDGEVVEGYLLAPGASVVSVDSLLRQSAGKNAQGVADIEKIHNILSPNNRMSEAESLLKNN